MPRPTTMLSGAIALSLLLLLALLAQHTTCLRPAGGSAGSGLSRLVGMRLFASRTQQQSSQGRTSKKQLIGSLETGDIIEYLTAKRTTAYARVVNSKIEGKSLEVQTELQNGKAFMVNRDKVKKSVKGPFTIEDFVWMQSTLKQDLVNQEKLFIVWRNLADAGDKAYTVTDICQNFFGNVDPIHMYTMSAILRRVGLDFFDRSDAGFESAESESSAGYRTRPAEEVEETRENRLMASGLRLHYGAYTNPRVEVDPAEHAKYVAFVSQFTEGFKNIVLAGHDWTRARGARRPVNQKAVSDANRFFTLIQEGASVKNARKWLEFAGEWTQHENVDVFAMNIRQEFPADVIEEAHYLIDNAARLPDCDERIRRDLRGLRSYAIDEKGTEDVDDAVSIEYLEDGREKIWIHIADVSRWVQPGSALSIEAERRMMTVYMPDERISMFPYVLATELLSLSAQSDSCALSCGITMDESGQVASYEVCPTKIKLTKQLTYKQVDLLLNEADPICFITDDVDDAKEMSRDIQRLFHWACVRQRYRLDQQGALSRYVSCRTNLNLIVKKDASKKPPKHTIIPLFSWSNASSINLVSEYMILMADTVGQMSITNDVPVWYKVQATDPPLTEDLLQLRPDETPYLRSCRLLRHLRGALDSKAPGPHATTGSSHYVQCTSPIRRYHDLYNHYRLKASMHAASMGKEWAGMAAEEAGISKLDNMATAEQRLQTIMNVMLVQRSRSKYWLGQYLKDLVAAGGKKPVLDCVIAGRQRVDIIDEFSPSSARLPAVEVETAEGAASGDKGGAKGSGVDYTTYPLTDDFGWFDDLDMYVYSAHVLQFGGDRIRRLYSPRALEVRTGDVVKGHLHARYRGSRSVDYLLLPADLDLADVPDEVKVQLQPHSQFRDGEAKQRRADDSANSDRRSSSSSASPSGGLSVGGDSS